MLSQPPNQVAPIQGHNGRLTAPWTQFFSLLFNALQPLRNTGSYQYVVATAGFTLAILDSTGQVQFDPAGAIAGSNSISLPPNPSDGQELYISTTQNISGITLSAASGVTIKNPFTTLTAGSGRRLYYNGTKYTWYVSI